MKLFQVIEELVEERGLDRNLLSAIMCEGLLAAYKKKYPDADIVVDYNRKSDEIVVMCNKTVVATVVDDLKEISPRKARAIKEDAQVGEVINMPFDGTLGRIDILRAKQLIAQKIRSVEAAAVFNEFKKKEGTVVYGAIHKCERNGLLVKVGDAIAFMPKSLMLPTDQAVVGYSIRALLKEVLPEPRNESQLILDRASADFLERLFELEIPEVFEKIVEIKKVVRIPGYKSKVLVASSDRNIDPVGTCVGVGGSRIKPILRELGSEKIDIIRYTDSIEDLIKGALKPAEIQRIEMVGDQGARVWLAEDQRSLAIGKGGQNIALASRLVDLNIQVARPDGAISQELDIDEENFEKGFDE